jgi:hypothetical protein
MTFLIKIVVTMILAATRLDGELGILSREEYLSCPYSMNYFLHENAKMMLYIS